MAVHHLLLSRLRQGMRSVRPMRPYLLLFMALASAGIILLALFSPQDLSVKISALSIILALMLGFRFQADRSKRMLERSAERLQRITDSVGEGLLVINAYKTITFVNPAAERLLGYAPDELTGKTLHAVFRNHTADCPICQAIEHGLKYHSDDQLASAKTQTALPVELTIAPIFEKGGRVTDAVVVFRDITRRKQALEALAEERNLLRILIDTIPDPIYIKDLTGRYLMLNTAFCTLFGKPGDDETDWIGKTAFDVLAREEAEELARLDRDVVALGQPLLAQEVFFRHVGQTGLWVSRSSTLLRHTSGEIFGILGINRDITRQKQAELQLLEANGELQDKNTQLAALNAHKDTLFTIISHDLRNPFNALLGFTYLLHDRLDEYDRDEIRAKVTKLRATAENLYALLENLLTWSRMQRDALRCEPETLSVRDLADENVMLVEPKAQQKGIAIVNAVPQHLVAYADESMTNTILRNLLSNALKFTDSGGQITIAASADADAVQIAVSDTGQGIDAEGLSKIFRANAHYTRNGTAGEPGTGLGLNVCKEMVAKQGGAIHVESVAGQGTTFRFTLPIAAQQPDKGWAHADEGAGSRG